MTKKAFSGAALATVSTPSTTTTTAATPQAPHESLEGRDVSLDHRNKRMKTLIGRSKSLRFFYAGSKDISLEHRDIDLD